MKTIVFSFLLAAAVFLLLFSCQREIHFDFISEGTFVKAAGNCQSPIVNGNYVAGQGFNSDNYIKVQVHITAIGSYSINSDTVNGFSFNANGFFRDTGLVTVKLVPNGIPLAAGIDQFDVVYGTSSCRFAITVVNSSDLASFTLQGSPGSCMVDTLSGVYIKAMVMGNSNKIKIAVNVTKTGAYTISSDTVNGYSFSSSGSLSTTGIQSISLTASGTPLVEGTDIFTLHAGSSSCNFSVTVLTSVPVTNNDHFPLTKSSYWDYTDLYYQGNIVTTIVLDTILKNGIVYRAMEKEISPGGPLILFYRKSGFDYFEYAEVDKYTASFQFTKRIIDDLPFLKEGLAKGEQWQSPEYSNMASNGQVTTLQYNYSCLDITASLAINGHLFNDVYEVQMKPAMKIANGSYQNTGEIYINYYAKGIGLIYYKETNSGSRIGELQIKDWQVN